MKKLLQWVPMIVLSALLLSFPAYAQAETELPPQTQEGVGQESTDKEETDKEETPAKTVAEIDATVSDLMTTARLYTDGLYWHYNPNRMLLNKATDVFLCNGEELQSFRYCGILYKNGT